MKKLAIIAAAFMLTLGLAQCKKEQTTAETPEGETVRITVNVGNNGSRANVDPSNGKITFKDGEKLYVGYNGAKLSGELTYSSSTNSFSGELTIVQDGDDKPLYFYYLGGGSATMVDATHYTVDISDQTSNYPVISCGTSTNPYTGAGAYTTTLLNQCALVKFSTNVASSTVSVAGMNTVATVNFGTNEITPGTTGTVSFATDVSGEGWAILLEQSAVNDATVTASGYADGTCDVLAITNNMFYTAGVSISLTAAVPEGALSGLFSVSSTKKVFFSKGNLQATTTDSWSTWTFSFMDHQYSTVETNADPYCTANYGDKTVVSLFGWGTSGYEHRTNHWQPNSTKNDNYYVAYYNAYYDLNQAGQNGKADWGYNAISNGGNTENSGWRTMTSDEWSYLLTNHTKGWATVNGVNGLVIRPYGVSTAVASTYTAEAWAVEEAAGTVFLPAAGVRVGNTDTENKSYVMSAGSKAFYWTATHYDNGTHNAYRTNIDAYTTEVTNNANPACGNAVRLVKDVN